MSNGAGRGRGWLNLAKNAEPPRPMGLSRPITNNSPPPPPISTENMELIDKIKELNVNDDGIMFNKKMSKIQAQWNKACTNQEEVEHSFEDIYNACLQDSELASKFIALVASRTFIGQTIHGCSIRLQFLRHLQNDVENSNQLQTQCPLKFRNCVQMLGEFFYKARSTSGKPFNILAVPFLSCLELLLNSKSLPELMLFTTQLFLNGALLRSLEPEELTKMSVRIRSIIVTEPHLAKDAKVWLLLALDLCNAKFSVLPTEVFKFYEDHLGATSIVNFQRPQDALSIQTIHSSKVLDSYQSNVNVLQISTSPTEMVAGESHQAPFNNLAENNSVQNDSFPRDVLANKNMEKTGRPILGAGARFIKKNEENGTCSNKQNGGRSHKNKKTPPITKSNKGWEHDDRFENDYN